MKLVKLTTGEQREVSIWVNPLSVQVMKQKIGPKYKAMVVVAGTAYPVWEEAEHIAKLINAEIEQDDLNNWERRLFRLSKENEHLKAALKPVLDCKLHIGDSQTEAVGEIGTSSEYGVCDEEGSDLWDEDIADNLNAVREAQRIFFKQQ